MANFYISTDKSKLDIQAVYVFLSHRSYWAKGRSFETVKRSIEHSLCFGVYDHHDQLIGFARVVTDYAVFAYILDLFVFEEHRGQGMSKALMDYIMNHEPLQGLQRIMLATSDAHGLYEKYQFKEIANPGIFMERVNKPR